jgi:uncharacterized protein (DUF1786 family)
MPEARRALDARFGSARGHGEVARALRRALAPGYDNAPVDAAGRRLRRTAERLDALAARAPRHPLAQSPPAAPLDMPEQDLSAFAAWSAVAAAIRAPMAGLRRFAAFRRRGLPAVRG